ncbi:hypothetical protein OJAV_G00106840 [Oryzias javanicus]|uniref:Uncharacterized protein n=1 Tax=Oryzias javanicus TaxID=123683 RepID=A0A437CTZ0_ORYJA|nr:hypothetical protein OJAV_G00106840 [Oryzias javanicus]
MDTSPETWEVKLSKASDQRGTAGLSSVDRTARTRWSCPRRGARFPGQTHAGRPPPPDVPAILIHPTSTNQNFQGSLRSDAPNETLQEMKN